MKRYSPATFVIAVAACAACFRVGPALSPAVAGCYAVNVEPWGEKHAHVTGLRHLPAVIALDTSYLGRVLVPSDWRDAGSPANNFAHLRLQSSPWQHVDDSLVIASRDTPRWLPADSVILIFESWGGSLAAYLARDSAGLSGSGFLHPRELAKGTPSVRLQLRPARCPANLVSGR